MSYLRTWKRDLELTGSCARIQSPAEEFEYADVDLAIVCESTYPYRRGGLSAVVHQICEGSPHLRIGIIHITWDSSFPRTDVFGMPDNVAWVMPVYQSMLEHKAGFQDLTVADLKMSHGQQSALVNRLFAALHAHLLGDDEPLWSLYDEGINSLTRRFNIWPILSTEAFMRRALKDFGASEEQRSELYCWLRDFFSLAYAVTAPTFPRAALYHAHTTGGAGLLAAAAARQHDTSFLLTEHNLYVRDSINHLLERSMDCVVSIDDWKELSSYRTRLGVERQVTPRERYWMQWFSRLGVIAYRAADRITYLYPEAIEEAAGLGGEPEKSTVVPNGLDPSPFRSARAHFRKRDHLRREKGYVWRLAHVGRVVPIKALTDLLESLHALRSGGLDGFVLDVMGPDDEFPDYVDLCHARVTELGLSEHVRFRGWVDLRAELGHFDMLLMPSHNEGLPIAILEAMAVGLPVIATDVGGVREVVTGVAVGAEGKGMDSCGIIIQPHDKSAMTESIQILLSDPALFDRYSRNSLARIQALYRMELNLARYHGIFHQLGAYSQKLRAASAEEELAGPRPEEQNVRRVPAVI